MDFIDGKLGGEFACKGVTYTAEKKIPMLLSSLEFANHMYVIQHPASWYSKHLVSCQINGGSGT